MRIFFFALFSCLTNIILAQDLRFEWVRAFGSNSTDQAADVAIDASGNVYTIGMFSETVDFDPGPAEYKLTSTGANDIFISKLDANGNFIWAIQLNAALSGSGGHAIGLDGNGNVYYTGSFKGTIDFDPGPGIHNIGSSSRHTSFVSKLDTDGNFIWIKRLVGFTNSIATDAAGNLYVTGGFLGGVDFDPGLANYQLTESGGLASTLDIFVWKLDNQGNFVWAKQMAGDFLEYGRDIAVDENGQVYITGLFAHPVDFDPGPGVLTLTTSALADAFVVKLDQNGDLLWAKPMGDSGDDEGYSLAVDKFENVFITGSWGANFFVCKMDKNGNEDWKKIIGGTFVDHAHSIALDDQVNVYVTGNFSATVDFDPGADVFNLTSTVQDIYILKLDSQGDFTWVKQFISSLHSNTGMSIKTDNSGNIYTCGNFWGTVDFDPDAGIVNVSMIDGGDLFILKLSPCISPTFTLGDELTICQGDLVPALPVVSANGIPGVWSPSVIDDQVSGTYTFTSACGPPVTFDVIVTPAETPKFSFGTSLNICSGNNVPALPAMSDNGITGTWNPATINDQASGTYTFTTQPGQCATATATLDVIVNPVATVNNNADTIVNDRATIPAYVFSGTPAGSSFTWSNSNPSIGLAASGAGNVPSFTATNNGDAPVSATITVTPTINGCTGAAKSYTITVKPLHKDVFVPNVFSPNGDGNNDILFVYGNFIDQLEMRIFNQWGEQQELLNSTTRGWNGTHRGKPQPVGVYTYALRAVLSDGSIVKMKGSITLLR